NGGPSGARGEKSWRPGSFQIRAARQERDFPPNHGRCASYLLLPARPVSVGMKLSKRGEYALRALIDLGIAAELGRPILQISELAAKEKLPIKFLEQIFTQLKASGFVVSKRGKGGGYSL